MIISQLSFKLLLACDVAMRRSSRFVGLEDILFLMRKDKVKLGRLFRYLAVKDMKAAVVRNSGVDEADIIEGMPASTESSGLQPSEPKTQHTKRVKLCYDFLSSIDETGEILSAFDEDFFDDVKLERNLVRYLFQLL